MTRIRYRMFGARYYESRLIMEEILGRPLTSGEHVHHKDENPENNDPDNLEVLTKSEHRALHNSQRVWTIESRNKLSRSLTEPAERERRSQQAKWQHQTQNLNPHILERLPEAFRILKENPSLSYRKLAKMVGISRKVLKRLVEGP